MWKVEAWRIGSRFYNGKGTRNVNAPSLYCIDLTAVLATAFAKNLTVSGVFHDVRSSKYTKAKNRLHEYHRDFTITKFMRDQLGG